MKICHVINNLSRGGAESHLYSLVKLQVEEGHEVSVMLLGRDSNNFFSLEESFRQINIEVIRFKGPKKLQGFNPVSIVSAKKYFSKNNFQIIHSHSPRSYFLTYTSHLFLSKESKWVVTIHGKYGTYLDGNKLMDIFRSYSIFILSRMWRRADSIIVISESIKDWLSELNYKIKPVVIPYGIAIPEQVGNESSGEITFGYLGRLNVNKGIEDLVNVFLDIKKEIKSPNKIQLNIGGVGLESYEKKLIKLTEGADVNFLGYVSDRKSFFNSINFFVFPSYSEGLGLVLLEAMSHRKICLTRDVDPMNKIINDGVNGYLFKNNEELKQIFLSILQIQDFEKNKIIKNATETIESSYSIIQMYSRIEETYKT